LAIEKICFSEKGDNRGISNTQRTGENRLQNFLTRSNFCELVASEFFNSNRIYEQQLGSAQIEASRTRPPGIFGRFTD